MGRVIVALLLVLAAGCSASRADAPFTPEYKGAEARVLDGDLVNIEVRMTGARRVEDVTTYADCVVARYALDNGGAFARHLRTKLSQKAGLWTADAVYTVSGALPEGVKTIDAEVVAANCAENGIPMV